MKPTARLSGSDLVLTRTFPAPIEDVWASVTEPDRTAEWFGTWTGDPGPGKTVRVQMAQEEGKPWFDLRIDACEAPHRLAVTFDAWRITLELTAAGDGTELRFVHHLDGTDGIGDIGPGWEWYLDLLAAARNGTTAPAFDTYYPAMKAYFESL